MKSVTRRPTRLTAGVAVTAALGALASTIADPLPALPIAAAGVGIVGTSLTYGSRRLLDWGAGLLFVGVAASSAGGPAAGPLVGTIALVVAWDLGGTSIRLGTQLGRDADTTRLELWYVISSISVGVATGTLAYSVYLVTARGVSLDAVAVILLAGIFATVALGTRLGWNDTVVRRVG